MINECADPDLEGVFDRLIPLKGLTGMPKEILIRT